MTAVVWHDLECGSYEEDRAIWRVLAREAGGRVLDVGAGTGRVTLDLAREGFDVVALDADGALLSALSKRARDAHLEVETITADARDLADLAALTGLKAGAVLVPMQTLQLLGGPEGRTRFLAGARRVLRPGGLLAAALAEALDAYEDGDLGVQAPLPDMREIDGVVYSSRPVAVRDVPEGATIVRVRETVAADGTLSSEVDEITLDRVDADAVALEAAPHGFIKLPSRLVPATDEYVGSEVVVLRAV